ncbi:hypothetical protein PBV87_12600 [Niameybacter massiliensis]|uniref:Uncharacterized protein n=1 Tax=Holtiella tumoricola TaxID=3018743 RepID=A0AA42DNV1_9FIRM|nr:hypothetical protein [Holtiella tumoricola]MDA3732327.1 hypothetical protein [Holtiella tumoricola]
MRHEVKKISKMVDELTTFFLEHQAQSLEIKINNLVDREIIMVEAIALDDIALCVKRLQRFLSYPREREMEEYYWELAGETDSSEELGLVGTMIDEANIGYDEEKIQLELIRRK